MMATLGKHMRKSLSQKVLARKQDILDKKASLVAKITFSILCIAIVVSGGILVRDYRRETKLEASPTWAQFKVNGKLNERVPKFNRDGVPASLIINGETWSVERVDHFNQAAKQKPGKIYFGHSAETYCKQKLIAYINHEDERALRTTLMHEVFHAGACLHGGDEWWNSINPTGDVHPGVYHLGEFASVFLRENPDFANWMVR